MLGVMTEPMTRSLDRRTRSLFLWFSLGVVALWTALLRGSFYAEHPSMAAFGVAIDLAITLPLVWYFAAIRRGKAAAATLVPMIVIGLLAAHAMTPGEPPMALLIAVGVVEFGVVTAVVIRLRRAIRESGGAADPLERIESFARAFVPVPFAAKAIASEIGIFWYAFFSWKQAPPQGEDVRRWAKVEDWFGVMIGLLVAVVAETIGLHFWLMTKWPHAVWLLTLSDLYAIVWLVADARALSLSAVRVSDGTLDIRFGMRWKAVVPLAQIESIESVSIGGDEKKPWDLKFALVEEPDTLITFREPVVFHGPYGFRKAARKIGVLIERGGTFPGACLSGESMTDQSLGEFDEGLRKVPPHSLS